MSNTCTLNVCAPSTTFTLGYANKNSIKWLKVLNIPKPVGNKDRQINLLFYLPWQVKIGRTRCRRWRRWCRATGLLRREAQPSTLSPLPLPAWLLLWLGWAISAELLRVGLSARTLQDSASPKSSLWLQAPELVSLSWKLAALVLGSLLNHSEWSGAGRFAPFSQATCF